MVQLLYYKEKGRRIMFDWDEYLKYQEMKEADEYQQYYWSLSKEGRKEEDHNNAISIFWTCLVISIIALIIYIYLRVTGFGYDMDKYVLYGGVCLFGGVAAFSGLVWLCTRPTNGAYYRKNTIYESQSNDEQKNVTSNNDSKTQTNKYKKSNNRNISANKVNISESNKSEQLKKTVEAKKDISEMPSEMVDLFLRYHNRSFSLVQISLEKKKLTSNDKLRWYLNKYHYPFKTLKKNWHDLNGIGDVELFLIGNPVLFIIVIIKDPVDKETYNKFKNEYVNLTRGHLFRSDDIRCYFYCDTKLPVDRTDKGMDVICTDDGVPLFRFYTALIHLVIDFTYESDFSYGDDCKKYHDLEKEYEKYDYMRLFSKLNRDEPS